MGRCCDLILLLTVPLLRSPQDFPMLSCRRPFRACSMVVESHQRRNLAEGRQYSLFGPCSRKWADVYASTSIYLPSLQATPHLICVIPALLYRLVEHQIILSLILSQPGERHTQAKGAVVLCSCIYGCFVRYLLGHVGLQMFGGTERFR